MKRNMLLLLTVFTFSIILFSIQYDGVAADDSDALPIVEDGQAQAVVVISEESDKEAKESADILVDYVKQSTGAELPVKTASELEENNGDEQTLIYIGEGFDQNDTVTEGLVDLDMDGFLIYSEDNQINIIGPTDRGTRNGVYDFLERYVDVIWLMPGETWTDVPSQSDINVPIENIREEPDFSYRSINMGGFDSEHTKVRNDWQFRNKIQAPREFKSVHNLRTLFPPEKYGETNPEFYPNGQPPPPGTTHGWQPCFTEPGTVDVAVAGIIEYFDENPEETSFSLSTNDGAGFCEADPSHPDYPDQTNSVGRLHLSEIYFHWVNQVVEQVAEVYPDKYFGAYAYMDTMDPPSFELHPNVVPVITKDRLAWIDEEVREAGHQHLADWQEKASQTGWYEYPYGYFYFLPRVYPHLMAENYKYSKEHDVMVHHSDMHQTLGDGPKPWLAAKLQWDVDQDVDILLDKWYERAVGEEAAVDLKGYFDLWERFWTERATESTWFKQSKDATYLDLGDFSYLQLVTEEDINESRRLLESVIEKTETEEQQKRAEQMLHQFEFYEASALSYGQPVDAVNNEGEALELLENVKNVLESRLNFVERRYELIEEFKEDNALKYPGNPFGRGGTWTGYNPYEFWNLKDYISEQEPESGAVTDEIKKLAFDYEPSKLRELSRMLLGGDLNSSLTENPSFEQGEDDASSWIFWNPSGSADIKRVEGTAYSGNSSVLFENTKQGGIYQTLDIQPGLLASQVLYYTPEDVGSKGTIQIVIEAYNTAGEKLIYRSESALLSDTAGEWASVGLLEDIPEEINGKEVTEILLNSQINNAEDVQVYQDDLVVYQYLPSSADMQELVERLEGDGEFANNQVAHALKMHLMAIDRFENQGMTVKVIKHMNGFNMLLDHHLENDQISEQAYDVLQTDSESLMKQFIGASLSTDHLQVVKAGDYPIFATLKNNTSQSMEVTLSGDSPKNLSIDWDSPIQLAADETIDVEGSVHLSSSLPEGEYEVLIDVMVDGVTVRQLPITVNYTSNLVQNAGFERLNNDGLPTSWGIKDGGDPGAVVSSPEAARNGENGIKMTTETSNNYFVFQEGIEIEGGKAYELSSWLKSDISSKGKAQMKIEFYHDTEGNKKDVWSIEYDSNEDWENAKIQAVAPSDANMARIFIRLYGPGTAYYDDVEFRMVEDFDYDNLIENHSFEELNINGEPAPWSYRDGGEPESVEFSLDAVRTGNLGIRMKTDSTNNPFVFQDKIEIEGGKHYELSSWLKSDIVSNGKAQMKIEFYHHTEGHIEDAWSHEYGSFDDWENISMQAKSPSDANRARVFLRLFGPGTVNYDDISFRLLDTEE